MTKIAKDLVFLAVELVKPELNVLASELIEENRLVVMAEMVPQSSGSELFYVVVCYKLDRLDMKPEIQINRIPTLERAQIIFEEFSRSVMNE